MSSPSGKPFDATTKQLVELSPGDWLAYLGLTGTTADVLLRREADGPAMTGVVGQERTPGEPCFLHFGYQIVRVWQKLVEAGLLWTATCLLMGLTYPPDFTAQLLRGVRQMKESSTYQAILAEGRAEGEARGEARGKTEEARRLLLRIGGKRLGPPDAQTEAAIAAVDSVERLEQLADRLLEVESWNELLG